MITFEQSRYFFNYILPDIILQKLELINNFLSQHWWLFFGIAIILFFISIKSFRKNLQLQSTFKIFDEFLNTLSKKKDMQDIEDWILKIGKILKAQYAVLYELRGETYIIIESNLVGSALATPLRISKKELLKFKKSGNFFINHHVSNDKKYMILFFTISQINIDNYSGHLDILLSYYNSVANGSEAKSGELMQNISKNISISLMKLQMDKYQFFKFFVALILKITKAKGAKLLTKQGKMVFEYSAAKNVSLQKIFYIRNTPYKLEFYDNSSMDTTKMGQIGAFLDMAGAFLVNIDKNSEMVKNYLELLNFTNEAIELESKYYKHHSKTVQTISVEIAKSLFLSEEEIDNISLGAYLHDIGMIGDLLAILDKDKLQSSEMDLIKEHPIIGSIIVEPISHIYPISNIIKYHHERYDGRGYPFGIKEAEIPIGAQVVALGEFYAGITGDRAYRKGKNHNEAVENIKKMKNKMFNPVVVDAFIDVEKSIKTKIIKTKTTKKDKHES